MHRRFQLLLLTAIAASAPAQAKAGSIGGQIGPTSRASIGITVSVAPRMGVYERSSARPEDKVAVHSFCVWSSSPSRAFTATLQDQGKNPDLTFGTVEGTSANELKSGKSLESTALSSMIECRSGNQVRDILLSHSRQQVRAAGGSPGTAVLILAPE